MRIESMTQRFKKLFKDLDMHYNIIMCFAHNSQSLLDSPHNPIILMKKNYIEDITIQQVDEVHEENLQFNLHLDLNKMKKR